MLKRLLSPALAGLLLFAACKDAPDADKAQVSEAQEVTAPATGTTYKADLAQSVIEWVGTKPTGRHHGTLRLKSGDLMGDGTTLTGGKFTIDLTTLKADDQDAEGNAKLAGHLASADFFDVAKYPAATFEITSVQPGASGDLKMKDATHTITGNLTLKDSTKSITFPAKVAVTPTAITADASFNMDRTLWGLNYNSDASIQDKFINKEVNLTLHLVATK